MDTLEQKNLSMEEYKVETWSNAWRFPKFWLHYTSCNHSDYDMGLTLAQAWARQEKSDLYVWDTEAS